MRIHLEKLFVDEEKKLILWCFAYYFRLEMLNNLRFIENIHLSSKKIHDSIHLEESLIYM